MKNTGNRIYGKTSAKECVEYEDPIRQAVDGRERGEAVNDKKMRDIQGISQSEMAKRQGESLRAMTPEEMVRLQGNGAANSEEAIALMEENGVGG
jgi:hypothetical protein